MTINDEVMFELFADVMCWSGIAALVSFTIGRILFLFSELLKENFFLSVCALVFICISGVLLLFVAAGSMIIPAIPGMLEQLHEMYLR